jgi:glycosyltransferase involved in cell wall biosynthesis
VEVDLVRAEEKRWPGWALRETNVPEDYFRRREQEWALADSIVVNSEFSRQALIRQGVPAGKLTVIPLCYETEDGEPKAGPREAGTTFSHQRPLKILFLGQVILRKGVQYLIEAAKLLSGEPVRFDIVGPIGIREEALRSVPANLTFHGRAVRDQAAGWYRQADLFVLPTLSDGFALTQIEAMAHGLPVIATPNCGDVVTPGVDGQIVPAGDAKALADAIMGYVKQSGLLADQREAALRKAGQFTLPHLAKNLAALETRLLSRS